MSRKPLIIHPFLFGLFPILFLFSQNIEQLPFSETLVPSGLILAFTAFFLPLLWLIFKKNMHKAGLLLSLSLILFFSYGHIYNVVEGIKVFSLVVGRHRFLMTAWLILFAAGLILIIKARFKLDNWTRVLNIISICLVAVALANIVLFEIRTAGSRWTPSDGSGDYEDPIGEIPQRDVYYIILDGYANASTLKEVYNYDNSEFTDFLEQKGFYVAHKSTSNYPSSFLSLSSSLNMEYINYLADQLGADSTDRSYPYNMIEHNKVMDFFKSSGYNYIHFSSGWGPTNYNQNADINISVSQYDLSEFQILLFRTTALEVFEKNLLKEMARMRVINTFQRMAGVPSMEGTNFVFAHVVCPHPPYVFGRNGEPVAGAEFDINIWGHEQKEHYLNQLIYLNEIIKDFVEDVLSTSDNPPIILLQADHGPRNTFIGGQHPTDEMFREGMRILNAYYMPNQEDTALYDSITPVNSFRVVFNTYFGTDHPILEDINFNSFENEPYRFTDITDIVSYN